MSPAEWDTLGDPVPPDTLALVHAHTVADGCKLLVSSTSLLLIGLQTEVGGSAVPQESERACIRLRQRVGEHQRVSRQRVEVATWVKRYAVGLLLGFLSRRRF